MIPWIIGIWIGFSALIVWALCRIAAQSDAAMERMGDKNPECSECGFCCACCERQK